MSDGRMIVMYEGVLITDKFERSYGEKKYLRCQILQRSASGYVTVQEIGGDKKMMDALNKDEKYNLRVAMENGKDGRVYQSIVEIVSSQGPAKQKFAA